MSSTTDKFGQTIYEIDGATLGAFMVSTAPVQIICGPDRQRQVEDLQPEAMGNSERPEAGARRRSSHTHGGGSHVVPIVENHNDPHLARYVPGKCLWSLKWTQPPCQIARWGDVEMQTDFLALDDQADVQKLSVGRVHWRSTRTSCSMSSANCSTR